MTETEWQALFGDGCVVTLENDQRPYFALEPIDPAWDTLTFFHREEWLYERTTVFFRADEIVKVIKQTQTTIPRGIRAYREYDTSLATEGRRLLLPLSGRGKAKKLTASAIDAVTPFGCELSIRMQAGRLTQLHLLNPRARRRFPIGLWDTVEAIASDADFQAFAADYIATCRADYFQKLNAFRTAGKVTVRYRPGDVFRVDYDRTRYRYGIITGELRTIRAMAELPEDHSFRRLMTVPILVRLYDIVTEDPDLTAGDLADVPLTQMLVCSDSNVIWGTHPVVDHRVLTGADLDFPLTAWLETAYTGRFTLAGSALRVEWGLAGTVLENGAMSDWLKTQLDRFPLTPGGVRTAIDPRLDQLDRRAFSLDDPKNRDLREEVFRCLGLAADTGFDSFAVRFGGLSRNELARRMMKEK